MWSECRTQLRERSGAVADPGSRARVDRRFGPPARVTPPRRHPGAPACAQQQRPHSPSLDPRTTAACTLVDLAASLGEGELERAISEADKLGLTDPDRLLSWLKVLPSRPGVAILRRTLARHTFRLTDSELERLFIPFAIDAGLPVPLTRQIVNGYRVDFWWADLGLVVETDGLTYHRTPAQQAADRRRDQVHTAAGLTQLRFTHWQVRFDPRHVVKTLGSVARRLVSAA
jgi:very-short-patch-repair endonuclease